MDAVTVRQCLKWGFVLALALPALPLRPAEIPVTGACSLVDAIHAANNDDDRAGRCPPGGAGADTLKLAQNVVLSAVDHVVGGIRPLGLPVITTTVVVDGGGFTIERAPEAPEFGLFDIDGRVDEDSESNASLTLHDVTVRNGVGLPGWGAISAYFGSIRLDNATLADNQGTAISAYNPFFSQGSVELRNSRVERNSVGISVTGPLTVENSVVADNQPGGGIRALGILEASTTVVVTQSLITGNSSDRNGGGIDVYLSPVSLVVETSTLSANRAARSGGGIYSRGDLTIRNSTLSGNHAGLGGGIYVKGYSYPSAASALAYPTMTVESTTVSGNTAGYAGGGLAVANLASGNVIDSTVSGNAAVSYGAGIDNYKGALTVTHSTVVGNTSPLGAGINGDAESATTVGNSIVAANGDGSNCHGPILSAGGNFDDDASCPGAATILPAVDFEIDLADNGGPTRTHALLAGSVATDAAGTCGLDYDQRGYRRSDGACDSGAFELGAVACASPCIEDGLLVGKLADLRVARSCRDASCLDTGGLSPLDFLRSLPDPDTGHGYYYLD